MNEQHDHSGHDHTGNAAHAHPEINPASGLPVEPGFPKAKGKISIALYALAGAVLVIGVLLALSIGMTYRSLNKKVSGISDQVTALDKKVTDLSSAGLAGAPGAAAPAAPTGPVNITLPSGAPMIGDANAKVTIVEFADFQCPFCGRFFTDTLPDLKTKYINTGKAKLYYQDFAFLGDESNLAANAAKCAADQGQFWQYHDYLFSHQNGENQGAFSAVNLKAFAKTLGLDTSKFGTCVDSNAHAADVTAETNEGKGYGVNSTPTIFIDGNMIVGAQPTATFEQAIDAELAK